MALPVALLTYLNTFRDWFDHYNQLLQDLDLDGAAHLGDIANLTPATNSFMVGNGTDWTAVSQSGARTALGLEAHSYNAPATIAETIAATSNTKTLTPLSLEHRFGIGTDVTAASIVTLPDDGSVYGVNVGTAIDEINSALPVGSIITLRFNGNVTLNHATTKLELLSGANTAYKTSDTIQLLKVSIGPPQKWEEITYAPLAVADARARLGLGSAALENTVPIAKGGTGATDAATARTNLGLGTVAVESTVPITKGGTGATVASTARTNLGLGTIATQAASSVAITGGTMSGVTVTGGSVSGITDLAIADGGTGASTVAAAFANLKQAATDTATGVVELSTDSEAITGTSTTLAITPANLTAKGYVLKSVQVITTSGTWTKPTGCRAVHVIVIGGGGAGGGSTATIAGESSVGAGGGAGGYAESFITSSLGVTETVTIGAAGLGVSGSTGGSGGTTSFGAHLSATGGAGGTRRGSSASNGGVLSPLGGVGSSGNIVNHRGQAGGWAISLASTAFGGNGGSTIYGSGGAYNGIDVNASGHGAGGAGNASGAGAGPFAGGNGAPGLIIVWEYS